MNEYLIITLTLVLSAFFSGCEMAFFSSNKLLLELNKKKHPIPAGIIDRFVRNPGMFLSTILIGNNVALVIYGLYMADLIEPIISQYIESNIALLLIQTTFSTLIILITAEFLPKTLFRIHPTFILNVFAVPLLVFYALFYPISSLTMGISRFIIKKVLKARTSPEQGQWMLGKVDLDDLLTEHHEKSDKDDQGANEIKLLKNALDFTKLKIRECIIPRTDLQVIEVNEEIEPLRKQFMETGLSKILVYKDSIDNIIGYVHVSSLFKHPKKLRNIVSPISIIPETMTANQALELFTKEHKSIALVVDEFGGTAGIVTLEDILEEIFGEINDEHDVMEHIEEQVGDNDYLFSARLEIDYLNEKYPFQLPQSEEYETIAGLILFHNQSIPEVEDIISIEHFTFEIIEASNAKIELVKVSYQQD
ncbi:HlyC/CorC family transporter [Carboxylicivirga mesophila]|uniref:HlyC/CorC family transporter n=1 Tax=Carboxylicivirga mesophila TaxID=1166478 RepID=A0ABS5KEK4_9BACT|nr:hemolysin family protein [Carboxylicivirga mesophila]MBS2213416.1 HlyC/CorC family transporter [Carboxylicivirga mesophila]